MRSILLTITLMLAGQTTQAAVWTAQNRWSDQSEREFGQWIERLPMDIFTNPKSAYHGISTDCADAAYSLRTIFAYEHSLPVKFRDSADLSNDSTKFDDISDPAQRLLRFVRYVNEKTGTYSLPEDTYPIAIGPQTLRSGTMFLHAPAGKDHHITNAAGHVYYVQSIPDNGIIRYVGSTVPQAVRVLAPRNGILFAPENTSSGYRAWKWPDSNIHPGESDEQFQLAGWHPNVGNLRLWQSWQNAIQKRIRRRPPTDLEQLGASTANLFASLKERAFVVNKGWNLYQTKYVAKGLKCMSAEDYDDYSTPTRDVRVQQDLGDMRQAADNAQGSLPSGGFFSTDRVQSYLESQKIEVYPGTVVNFSQIWNAFMEGRTPLWISEPEHPPAVRWGLQKWDDRQWPCPDRRKQYHGASVEAEN